MAAIIVLSLQPLEVPATPVSRSDPPVLPQPRPVEATARCRSASPTANRTSRSMPAPCASRRGPTARSYFQEPRPARRPSPATDRGDGGDIDGRSRSELHLFYPAASRSVTSTKRGRFSRRTAARTRPNPRRSTRPRPSRGEVRPGQGPASRCPWRVESQTPKRGRHAWRPEAVWSGILATARNLESRRRQYAASTPESAPSTRSAPAV